MGSVERDCPTDSEFKTHFQNLLNEEHLGEECDTTNSPYVPLLDDEFSMMEFRQATGSLNKKKSYIGICPGLLNILPANWMMFF